MAWDRIPFKCNILVGPGILSDFENADLIEERHVTERVDLLITATVVPFHVICMVTLTVYHGNHMKGN